MQKQSFLSLLLLIGVSLLAAYQAFTDASAQVAVVRFLALSAFFLLCVALVIGPLAVLRPQAFAPIIESRRSVGLAAFFLGALHAILAMALYFNWDFGLVVSTFPLAIALPALVILIALALTSCDFAVQKMGMAKWKMLQYFAYPAFLLLLVHFVQANWLFGKQGAGLNPAEISLVLFAAVAIILQVAGFYVRTKRKAASSPS